ncbi:MAG TPA: Lrp/AsnC family transcriptional regulator [Burkholderiaceae bacterium]|nr:Lrp/AsnC family transcriptional regulator [Burkholderiaceae bacterium]
MTNLVDPSVCVGQTATGTDPQAQAPVLGLEAEDSLELRLLNDYQRDFPLCQAPYARIAEQLDVTSSRVLARLASWIHTGIVSRIGAVLRPGTVGASTLCAMQVPEHRLEEVAARISAQPAVNHNYEREHRFNLWFVAAAQDAACLGQIVSRIEAGCGLAALRLPLVREFLLDLGFALDGSRTVRSPRRLPQAESARPCLDASDRQLLAALQGGLALVERPFAVLAQQAGWSGAQGERLALTRIDSLLNQGVIKRFGVIVRHRALGFHANAMCVWDVPEDRVGILARRLVREHGITLCYERARAGAIWPYNLYCMIHGRDRRLVQAQLHSLCSRLGLAAYRGEVLFSKRAFKQCGANYFDAGSATHG